MPAPTFTLIIPAAGSGKRMGSEIPKPYLKLGDKTVLEHTIARFLGIEGLQQIVISTSENFLDYTKKNLSEISDGPEVVVVKGGIERQDSIRNALTEVRDNIQLIAVHDAVRPFIDKKVIQSCLEKADQSGAAIVAVRVKDTIKKVLSDQKISETPERKYLWQAQTPQIFRRELIIKAYKFAAEKNFTGTDDASLVENFGHEVLIVEGDNQNFKLTYPFDFKIAEALISENEELK